MAAPVSASPRRSKPTTRSAASSRWGTDMAGPLLLVCSSGGHLAQLHALHEAWEPFDRIWVTFDKSDAGVLLRDERVIHAHGPTNRNIPNTLRNVRLARQ